MELWSETILAVSDVNSTLPELEARGGDLLDPFEMPDLSALRHQAKIGTAQRHRAAGTVRQVGQCAVPVSRS